LQGPSIRFTESDWNRLKELNELAGRRTPSQEADRRSLGYRLLLAASTKTGMTRKGLHQRDQHAVRAYDRAVGAGLKDLAPIIAADIAAHVALNQNLSEVDWRIGTESFYTEIFSLREINAAIGEIKDAGLWPKAWMGDNGTAGSILSD